MQDSLEGRCVVSHVQAVLFWNGCLRTGAELSVVLSVDGVFLFCGLALSLLALVPSCAGGQATFTFRRVRFGTTKRGRCGQKDVLKRLYSTTCLGSHLTPSLLKASRCKPLRERTRDNATYAIPSAKMSRSSVVMTQSSVKPCAL